MWLVITEVRSKSFGLVERRHWNARPIYAARFYVAHIILCIDELLAVCCAGCIFHCRSWYLTLSLHYAHNMCVFDVRASSSCHRLLLCQISFKDVETGFLTQPVIGLWKPVIYRLSDYVTSLIHWWLMALYKCIYLLTYLLTYHVSDNSLWRHLPWYRSNPTYWKCMERGCDTGAESHVHEWLVFNW